MSKQRIAAALAVPCTFALVAWVGGYDFDTRGFGPAYTLFMCIAATLFVWFFPGWEDRK